MNKQDRSRRTAGLVVLVAVVISAGLLACRFCGQRSSGRPVPAISLRDEYLEERRARLNACARRLAEGSPGAFQSLERPSEEVVKAMRPDERKVLATGASRLLDRFMSTHACSSAEHEWALQALSLLRLKDGDEAAALIRRVHNIPLHEIASLEELSQVERLMLAVYPEMVSSGEAEAVRFDRSSIKKAIIRRQLFLLKERSR